MMKLIGIDQHPTHAQHGAALISVILILGLLSLLVTTLSVYVTNSATAIAIERDRINENALVESALEFGMGRVLSTPPGLPIEGEDRIRLQSGKAKFNWRGETARLDINFVDADLLAAIFLSFDLNKDNATSLARLIVAKRSLQPNQAIPKDFRLLAGKKLGPFDHIRELLDIPGMTPALFARLMPLVTIYGASAGIDPRLADRALLQALPNISRPLLAELKSLNDMNDEDAQRRLSSLGELARYFDLQRRNTVRFSIEIETAQGLAHLYDVVAVHYTDDARPYRILSWQKSDKAKA
jgi:general secretion pathway protein K